MVTVQEEVRWVGLNEVSMHGGLEGKGLTLLRGRKGSTTYGDVKGNVEDVRVECPSCEVATEHSKWVEGIVEDVYGGHYECPACKAECTADEVDSQVSKITK